MNTTMHKMLKCFGFAMLAVLFGKDVSAQSKARVLSTDQLREYTNYFNSLDSEDVKNYVPNAQTFDWLAKNVPLFECPDSAMQKVYYYRWWSFRKHLKETPAGFSPKSKTHFSHKNDSPGLQPIP